MAGPLPGRSVGGSTTRKDGHEQDHRRRRPVGRLEGRHHTREPPGHPRPRPAHARQRLPLEPLSFDVPPSKGVPTGGVGYNDSLRDRAAEELDAAVAELERESRGEAFFAVGDPAKVLADASAELDLLVVGSRGYGPLHAVLVGGVAGRVVREAACPVIVLPRKAGHPADDSLFAEAVSTHR